jgi:Mg2+/Co2+ transporter CorC
LLAVALWVALLLAGLTTLAAIVKAALEVDEDNSAKAETLSFLRMTLTGIFGVTLGQSLVPLGWSWWLTAVLSILVMILLLLGSQIAARKFGHRRIGTVLAKSLGSVINSLHLLFTPLSLPKVDEPEEFEQELIESVEEFGETLVREIMVPRVDMATISSEASLSEAMEFFLKSGFSRLPVVGDSIDDIKGILYLKDLTRILHEGPKSSGKSKAQAALRKVVFIPESMPVDDLLKAMQANATHIAIVVDEYGGVAGLVTLEDIIEELVGEIADEYDDAELDVVALDESGYRVAARYSLFELGELFKIDLEDEDVDSVGGLLAKELGRLPVRGDEIKYSGLIIRADRIEGRRKRLVSVIVSRDANLSDAQAVFGDADE